MKRFFRFSPALAVALVLALVASQASAVATVDLSTVATQATEDINATLTSYLPVLALGIGVTLSISWARRLFKR